MWLGWLTRVDRFILWREQRRRVEREKGRTGQREQRRRVEREKGRTGQREERKEGRRKGREEPLNSVKKNIAYCNCCLYHLQHVLMSVYQLTIPPPSK